MLANTGVLGKSLKPCAGGPRLQSDRGWIETQCPRGLGLQGLPGLRGVEGGGWRGSVDQRVTVAGLRSLSPSVGNDYVLPILSPPCSFGTGLHPSSPHTEGVARGGPAPSSGLPSVLLEDVRRAEPPPGQVAWKVDVAWAEGG